MIKAVIFDFFGVIVTEGLKQFLDTYFPNDPKKRKEAINEVVKFDSGVVNITRKGLVDELARMAGVSSQKALDYFNDNQPNKLLLDYIQNELKPKYKIGVLSNAGDNFISELLSKDEQQLFDDVVLSYRFGMAKPKQEIYELAAERLNVLTTECVFVDDSPSHCEGAKRSGMKTVWYEDFPQVKKDLEKILSSGSHN
jgi:HAD superfamily hydrolase (TIGR01509 family)